MPATTAHIPKPGPGQTFDDVHHCDDDHCSISFALKHNQPLPEGHLINHKEHRPTTQEGMELVLLDMTYYSVHIDNGLRFPAMFATIEEAQDAVDHLNKAIDAGESTPDGSRPHVETNIRWFKAGDYARWLTSHGERTSAQEMVEGYEHRCGAVGDMDGLFGLLEGLTKDMDDPTVKERLDGIKARRDAAPMTKVVYPVPGTYDAGNTPLFDPVAVGKVLDESEVTRAGLIGPDGTPIVASDVALRILDGNADESEAAIQEAAESVRVVMGVPKDEAVYFLRQALAAAKADPDGNAAFMMVKDNATGHTTVVPLKDDTVLANVLMPSTEGKLH